MTKQPKIKLSVVLLWQMQRLLVHVFPFKNEKPSVNEKPDHRQKQWLECYRGKSGNKPDCNVWLQSYDDLQRPLFHSEPSWATRTFKVFRSYPAQPWLPKSRFIWGTVIVKDSNVDLRVIFSILSKIDSPSRAVCIFGIILIFLRENKESWFLLFFIYI